MAKGTIKLARRGLPSDRALRPQPVRGETRDSFVPLAGSGYDVPFPKSGTPAGSGKISKSKANGSK